METTVKRVPRSEFLHPKPELAQCTLGGFVSETRGCSLSPRARFNHFLASPVCALSISFHLMLHVG